MKTLKRLSPDPEVIKLQKLLTVNGYFKDNTPQHGLFEEITHENVILFQVQHVDQDGTPLAPDGVVGEKTWWALTHPSGEHQRNHFIPITPQGLTPIPGTPAGSSHPGACQTGGRGA